MVWWLFGVDILKLIIGICLNIKVYFIVGDFVDSNVKVFICDGCFFEVLYFEGLIFIYDVIIDWEDSVYVFCILC